MSRFTRARAILNPVAGKDAAPGYIDTISARLRERFDSVEIVLTTGPGDAEHAASVAVSDHCDLVVVGGGDGTLNEVVNGVARVPGALARTAFGLIPLGTGNDFAAALGVPTDVDGALDLLLRGRVRQIDLGWVNARVFANISGGGFVAEVSDAVTPQMKSIAGRLAYLIGGAQALLDFEPVHVTVIAEPSGVRIATRLYAFAVCNSRLIGGGKLIAPDAVIDDGLLDVCLIENMSSVDFVALLRKVAQGSHIEDPRVHYLRASELAFTFERPVKVNTDGEVLEAAACEYRVLPGAARFVTGDAPFAAGAPS